MRDESFVLDTAARDARPPFSYAFLHRRPTERCWSVRDGRNVGVGLAKTRAGARAAVRALYALAGHGAAGRDRSAGR
ncbi:hypothetical protein [Phenylobacterium sp.]|uniref:hypothetical protein n=1 Tax=Phenylobacterium sp. TaxID=1871053 RepID=UPI00391C4208